MALRAVSILASLLATLAVTWAATAPSPAAATGPRAAFEERATFQVSGEVAEILAVTPNGKTLVYTDSAQEEIGVVDLRHPDAPVQLATVPVAGEPTSVAITREGRYALVTVDTSSSFVDTSGELVVVDVAAQKVVRTVQLGGQPDSIAISPDGTVGAVAIENQRDEERIVNGVEGGLPQAPSGFLVVVRLSGRPAAWTTQPVGLSGLTGARYPGDPEPEYVDINAERVAAVTLQENNAVALVDLATAKVVGSFSAGEVRRYDADTADDDNVSFDTLLDAPREPDAVQWTPGGNLVTADEGDLAPEPSGGRGWTVFTPTGRILFWSAGTAERALANDDRYPDGRSDDKGAEFEGAEVAKLGGDTYAFIGSERGDAVLVYDFADESRPRLLQVLPTGSAPEGLLAIPQRRLFLTSNEDDGTISVFGLSSAR